MAPPAAPKTGAKRGRPPGKSTGGASASTAASKAGAKRKRTAPTEDDDQGSGAGEPGDDDIAATLEALEARNRVAVPAELLRRILHESFQEKGMRMTQEASAGFARYLDLFVREAVRRASDEKGGSFLEVEALEMAAPQLLLDF
ncbi:hypothetical protein GQ53DRAFT_815723 [Thozetella sp. PMI_491]|nr:hypothetical protein GQ53DRAFT_815723 [Thozetella sp. PMI_491]